MENGHTNCILYQVGDSQDSEETLVLRYSWSKMKHIALLNILCMLHDPLAPSRPQYGCCNRRKREKASCILRYASKGPETALSVSTPKSLLHCSKKFSSLYKFTLAFNLILFLWVPTWATFQFSKKKQCNCLYSTQRGNVIYIRWLVLTKTKSFSFFFSFLIQTLGLKSNI